MNEDYRMAMDNIAYLCACAVRSETPDQMRVAAMDLDMLYRAAERHMLTAITAMALERAGITTEKFTQAKGKAIRKIILMDTEKTKLFSQLEIAEIWYMPLKGAVLKDLYPTVGMRQMSDFDILFDASRADELPDIMKQIGFSADHIGGGHHDSYEKQPVCRFEMHRMLFSTIHDEKLYNYYKDVKSTLIKDESNQYGYHFSDEDFYLYMIAHEYKHFSGGGTGLRSLLDTYIYLRKKKLDWTYIVIEAEKLGFLEFEQQNRELAIDLFEGNVLSEEESNLLNYVLDSGTYGSVEHSVKKRLQRYGGGRLGKIRYVFGRLRVPIRRSNPKYEIYASFYPFFYQHKIRIPLLIIYRAVRAVTVRRKRVKSELRALNRQ